MRVARQDTARTIQSLVAAASEVFAEKGYRDATIAEISERAGANIAAVNYHFGNKETLYREAWRQSFRDSIATHPPDGGVDANATAERRVMGAVAAFLRRVTENNNKDFLIVLKEMASPTGLLEEVMEEEVTPLRYRMETLVREVLGPDSSELQVRFCAVSLISQCVMPALMNRKVGAQNDPWKIDNIESYAEHVVAFSLAGMGATRDRSGYPKVPKQTQTKPLKSVRDDVHPTK
jgi:TetR/AcrR family transcriptional regulator, regulator of cefoperazone and chloramphenicol sensitivity